MKRTCQLLLMIILSVNITAQKTSLLIPELKNLNPKDLYPSRSLVAIYAETFDILIALGEYSNWIAFEQKTKVLAHKENGWYKINIRAGYIFSDTTTATILIIKINNAIGDSLWNIFITNHLFDMEDERTKKTPICDRAIFDADQHEFEIITATKYKKIYFYAPEYYEEHCPGVVERKQILNCLKAFEKYLGK
jgi:hypothetical protein